MSAKPSGAEDHLTLKWGTLKSWSFHSERGVELCEEYASLGMSFGCAQQRDTTRQKEIICALIDEGNFEQVFLDWDGRWVSKEEAKEYVLGYGKNGTAAQKEAE